MVKLLKTWSISNWSDGWFYVALFFNFLFRTIK